MIWEGNIPLMILLNCLHLTTLCTNLDVQILLTNMVLYNENTVILLKLHDPYFYLLKPLTFFGEKPFYHWICYCSHSQSTQLWDVSLLKIVWKMSWLFFISSFWVYILCFTTSCKADQVISKISSMCILGQKGYWCFDLTS